MRLRQEHKAAFRAGQQKDGRLEAALEDPAVGFTFVWFQAPEDDPAAPVCWRLLDVVEEAEAGA